jgi:carboxyl-terminal processing protease
VLTTAVLGGWFGDRVSAGSPAEEDSESWLRTFTSALAAVEGNYVQTVPTRELVESAIRGMLRTLDPHSSFFTRGDYNRLQEEQRGRYYGLGITIRAESPGSGRVVVVEPPTPGTPAYKSGIKAGDVISRIEGEPIGDWDLNREVIPNLKGPKGTKVNITIERPGELEFLELSVTRDEIPLYTIKYAFLIRPQIGYLKINKFSESTGKELNATLKELGEGVLKGLVLDLRDNPGGALSQALAVSGRFLRKEQLIVSTRGRDGSGRQFLAEKGSEERYPMVVLINENSASASEIVAGALQDHDRALIVGATSFGKALVQTIYPLQGNRGLALTTGRYYTPSDRLIQRDYSDSLYDYYFNRVENSGEEQEQYQTDAGRVVFGGGGITPDQEVSLGQPSKLLRLLDRKNLFIEFVNKLTNGEIQSDVRYQYSREERNQFTPDERERLVAETEVTDQALQHFKEFVQGKDVEVAAEAFEENRRSIVYRIKQELFSTLFDDEEGFKVALEIDPQVQRAIELLPKAATLLRNGLAKK